MLSSSAIHAVRALALLAQRDRGEAIRARELSRRLRVPGQYLSKVLAALTRAGVLAATRGVNGGYRLARRADRIRLIEVVGPFEGERAKPGCLLRPSRPCRDSGPCSAHGAWGRVKKTYSEFLERTTVEDIQGGV